MRTIPTTKLPILISSTLISALLLSATGKLHAQGSSSLPPGDGKELVEQACLQCHGERMIMMLRDGALAWKNVVDDMVIKGAQLLPDEAETVSRYLAKNFGPGRDPMKTGKLPQLDSATKANALPNAPGKDLVVSRCTVCHDAGIIGAVTRTKQDWASVVKDMFSRGSTASPEQMEAITSYLAKHFGQRSE